MIKSIFACDSFGGIGNRGTLPWPKNSKDMEWFKNNTMGHIVVMGKTTWDDPAMPASLPGRINVVVTHKYLREPNILCYGEDWKEKVVSLGKKENKDVWIIGGKSILEQSTDIVEEAYITRFKGKYYTDVGIDLHKYLIGSRLRTVRPGDEACTFEVWRRWWKV